MIKPDGDKLMQKEFNTKHKNANKVKLIIAGVVLLVMAALVTILILQRLEIINLSGGQTAEQSQEHVDALKEKISKLTILPDENATVATVTNADTLKEQAFFKDVQNGDKVLIFSEAGKAYIYREKDNLIVNSGPILLDTIVDEATKPETSD